MSISGVVKGQRLSVTQDFIVGGTINYLTAYFSFTCDWNGLLKIAHFRGKKDGKEYCIEVELKNNSITEDYGLNLTSGTWRLSILGYDIEDGNIVKRITTNEVSVAVHKTGECGESAEPFPEIKPSYGETVIAKAEEACRLANEVKESADRGDFNGRDYEHSEEFATLSEQVHKDAEKAQGLVESLPSDFMELNDDVIRLRQDMEGLKKPEFKTNETLVFREGVLCVNTTEKVEADNTLPVTSAAVDTVVGNIEILLKII